MGAIPRLPAVAAIGIPRSSTIVSIREELHIA
jgi:hypothetical protein